MTHILLVLLEVLFTAQLIIAVYFLVRLWRLASGYIAHVERSHTALEARLKEIGDAVRALKDVQPRSPLTSGSQSVH
jgi:hypothetical protein